MLIEQTGQYYRESLKSLLIESVNTDFEDLKQQEKSFYTSDVEDVKNDIGSGNQRGLQLPITYTANWSFIDKDGKQKTYSDHKNSRKTLEQTKNRAEQIFSKFPNSKIWLTKWIGSEKVTDDLVIHEPTNWKDQPLSEDIIVDDQLQIDTGIRFKRNEETLLKDFLKFTKEYLQLDNLPVVHILDTRTDGMTYGAFSIDNNELKVYGKNRGLADVMRTSAHELTHYKQKLENKIPKGLNYRDKTLESEANTIAGDIVYMYGLEHPEIYELGDSEIITDIANSQP